MSTANLRSTKTGHMLKTSKIKKRGTSGMLGVSRASSSKVESGQSKSRFMSRMKGSMVGTKYGRSQFRKKGSSKYAMVREDGNPIIFREGTDVTPLPIQIDSVTVAPQPVPSPYDYYGSQSKTAPKCFIPLTEPILHPTSMSIEDDSKENEAESSSFRNIQINLNPNPNNTAIRKETQSALICTETDNALDLAQSIKTMNRILDRNPEILDQDVLITLSETKTRILFEMPSLAVSNRDSSTQERDTVVSQNETYQEVLLKHSDTDLFTSTYTQTYNPPIKEQAVVAKPPATTCQGTQASNFDIHDAFRCEDPEAFAESQRPKMGVRPPMVDMTPVILGEMAESKTFQRAMVMMENAVVQNFMAEQQMLYRVHAATDKEESNEFESDDENEMSMKCAVNLRVEIDSRPMDRSVNEVDDELQEHSGSRHGHDALSNVPHFQQLWSFQCPATEGLSCTALDYNPINEDLIVAGYGSWHFGNKQNGKIMFWTLKNPFRPIRVYEVERSCVVSLNFSRIHPYLLAVGLFDGTVAVYDLRNESKSPILQSELHSAISESKKQNAISSTKHSTPVWNVLWERPTAMNTASIQQEIEKEMQSNSEDAGNANIADGDGDGDGENDDVDVVDDDATNQDSSTSGGRVQGVSAKMHRRQKLFSIASDGFMKQWSMKKGFISSNIMSLKRVPNAAAKRGSVIDNTIRSRQASGLCFDFPIGSNGSQYYVGTEDGIVHKCSVSYNEQVLKTYCGHTGPVNRVHCSPFDADKFISCSADWTINVWSQNQTTPLLQVTSSTNEAVVDCCWSPFDSCIFASASESGTISVWDLEKNKKDALIIKDTKKPIKQIMFAPNAPAILCGRGDGSIEVLRLNNVNTERQPNDEQLQMDRLNKALESDV